MSNGDAGRMNPKSSAFTCVLNAWRQHEAELRRFLAHRLSDPHLTEDLLQEIFLKAIQQGNGFCRLNSARAWLFTVARNAVADHYRLRHELVELPDDLAIIPDEPPIIDNLAACLPRVLSELSETDREAILLCDLQGMKQETFAQIKGLSLAGAKSRVQRARQRLMARLTTACRVAFDEHGQVACFVPRPPEP